MPKDAPFDVWEGEELTTTEVVEDAAPEEQAMHVEVEGEAEQSQWSELVEAAPGDGSPVSYFSDEQPDEPEVEGESTAATEHEPDLEELLERQHYTFPS